MAGAERPREEAYSLLRQTECHVAARQRDKAAATASAARALALRIGAAPIVADVDALLAGHGCRRRLRPGCPRRTCPTG